MPQENEVSHLICMPDVVFEQILSHLTYDAIAKTRIVCHRFNNVCQRLLNRGFYSAVQFHAKCSKEVKSQLPRRESKRSNHPLARHNNILHAIETRLSLLKMTYCKYIHYNACCFIPGKVVDELFRVLRLVNNTKGNHIPHEVLTELRDISSMAMDYFEEKIVPTLRNPNSPSSPQPSQSSSSLGVLSSPFSSKAGGLSSSSHSGGAAYNALNASMQATLSSLSHCYGELSGGSSLTGGLSSNSYFLYSDELLDGEMKNAIDSLVPPPQAPRPSLSTATQLVPVPADTLKALVEALRETRGKKTRAERHLAMMQAKLLEVSRKVQDQERTISEQSRLLAEHSVRFSQHSRSIFEIINNSVTAEVVDLDHDNLSLLSIPDYNSDIAEYSDMEPGTDDDGTFGAVDEGNHSLEDPLSTAKHGGVETESDVSTLETKEPNTEEKQCTSTLDDQYEEDDSINLKTNKSCTNVGDSTNVNNNLPSLADSILRTPSATEPMALSGVLRNLPGTESRPLNDIFSKNPECFISAPCSLTLNPRVDTNDDSQPSTSRGRPSSLPRCHLKPRIGKLLKASAAASPSNKGILSLKTLSTVFSSLTDSEASLTESKTSSSCSSLTEDLNARLSAHLRRLQPSSGSSPMLRKSALRKNFGRSSTLCGSLGQPRKSPRSLSALRPPLLKTPDGRIIVIRQRPSDGCSAGAGSAADDSMNGTERREAGTKTIQSDSILTGDATSSSTADHPCSSENVGGTLNLLKLSSALSCKHERSSSKMQHQTAVLQKFCENDSRDTNEEARKTMLPTIPLVRGGEKRKRKLGITRPPSGASGTKSKVDKVEEFGLDNSPSSEECSGEALLASSVSPGGTTFNSGVTVLTSDEESDDSISYQDLKKSRTELLQDLKKNYAD